MRRAEQGNETAVVEFIILGFQSIPEVQFILFVMFLVTYITTVLGNLLIMVLVVTDHHLHNPMFFFLRNLSFLDTCYTSTILLRMLSSFLTNKYVISLNGCFLQYFFFTGLAGAECCLLTVMSYDRYIAICKPLHYTTIMNSRCCLQLAGGSWVNGLLASAIVTCLMPQLTFCGPNEIDHFFCDFMPVVKLACSDTRWIEVVTFILASLLTLPPFLLTLISYVYISNTVLRIPSSTGRHTAFSTCSSHLTVVTFFYGTLIVVYLVPKTNTLRDLHKVFSVCYTVLTPLVNPLIYSLRNNNIKKALRTAMNKYRVSDKA
ncbi:PREDICTED: olfactory receptor 11A1-like [Phaethon lepturus]|uniref:olfactory receptor 11A1-like n=1 Tax=Phaethon lepturus TaxID=97097 RepID=UPI000530B8B7|nr:PREDICTED: olfactory receptor 11A1-like [Phaethon lepturus]